MVLNLLPRNGPMVFDWHNRPVGRVVEHRRGEDPRMLVVRLSEDARERLHAAAPDLSIPLRYVYGVRRGEVTLDRSLDALARGPPAEGAHRA